MRMTLIDECYNNLDKYKLFLIVKKPTDLSTNTKQKSFTVSLKASAFECFWADV